MKKTKRCWKFLLSIFLLFFLTLQVNAQVNYDGKKKILTIGNAIEYYIDSSSTQTIQSIQQQKHFIRQQQVVPDFGLVKSPIWLKITVTNRSQTPNLLLEFDQSLLLTLDFYSPQDGSFTVNHTGELLPFSSRTINYHKIIYNLNIGQDSTKVYYARLVAGQEMQLPIFLGEREQIVESNLGKNIFFGIFFGIILVMFFYNLFIYFSVKDTIYLYYVVYILAGGMIQAVIEGYCFQFLWPDNVFLATRSLFIFTALVNITGLEFTRKFLNARFFLARADKIAYGIYTVYLVAIVAAVTGNYYVSYQILQKFAGFVALYILAIAIIIAKRGYRPAKFFLIAWLPLIAGIIILVLKDLNILPYNVFTNYSIAIGSVLEIVLLSFALADKINIFKAEKEKSQQEALEALQENERIIREQNVVLEQKVEERTHELNETNHELNKTLVDLKEAQSQLVESEKMASLGQLTAGIAHEINNPINFVTSNVNPLKRDIEMVMEALTVIEEVGASSLSAEEKSRKIQDYKEELDFDYLLMEIRHLIKGINEGANRTAEIVKGLKVFSRLDEDDLKKADLNEGLDSTMVIANNMLNGKIKVLKEYSELPLVECYAGKLNQVFLNIISNAVYAIQKKFGETEGGELTLATSADEHNVYVKIKDNGIGMDETVKHKMFEPFFTTKDVGEGTGLGMSITYNTIKKHHGNINVESTVGEGTEFTLVIPIIFVVKET